MTVGQIVFDGASSSMYSTREGSQNSRSWTITVDKAIFNNIVARGSIEASVFKYGEVTAVGGIILARPASKITNIDLGDYNTNSETTSFLATLEEGVGFEEGGYCLFTSRGGSLVKEYYYVEEVIENTDNSSTKIDGLSLF
jgi:hypothetical protein